MSEKATLEKYCASNSAEIDHLYVLKQKNSQEVFCATFFQKSSEKPQDQTNSPTPLFLLIPQGAKEKALQKENAVRGFRSLRRATRATRPRLRKFFEKNLTKNFLRAFA